MPELSVELLQIDLLRAYKSIFQKSNLRKIQFAKFIYEHA